MTFLLSGKLCTDRKKTLTSVGKSTLTNNCKKLFCKFYWIGYGAITFWREGIKLKHFGC